MASGQQQEGLQPQGMAWLAGSIAAPPSNDAPVGQTKKGMYNREFLKNVLSSYHSDDRRTAWTNRGDQKQYNLSVPGTMHSQQGLDAANPLGPGLNNSKYKKDMMMRKSLQIPSAHTSFLSRPASEPHNGPMSRVSLSPSLAAVAKIGAQWMEDDGMKFKNSLSMIEKGVASMTRNDVCPSQRWLSRSSAAYVKSREIFNAISKRCEEIPSSISLLGKLVAITNEVCAYIYGECEYIILTGAACCFLQQTVRYLDHQAARLAAQMEECAEKKWSTSPGGQGFRASAKDLFQVLEANHLDVGFTFRFDFLLRFDCFRAN